MSAGQKYDVVLCRKLFPNLSSSEVKAYRDIEREAREKLKIHSRNKTFALNIPAKLRLQMREPESMTKRKRNRNYLQRQDTMPPPTVLYRGRGRSMRILRDAEDCLLRCSLIRLGFLDFEGITLYLGLHFFDFQGVTLQHIINGISLHLWRGYRL